MLTNITYRDSLVNTHRVRRSSRSVNNGRMGFKQNLRNYRRAANLTQEQLALACGWAGQSRIANYEKGIREPTLEEVTQLAGVLGVEAGELMGTVRPASKTDVWSDVRGYAQAVGLGAGAEAQEYAETHKLKFKADSLARKRLNPGKLAVMYGNGDSMEPRIHAGDAILFDTSDTKPRDGALYVIILHGRAHAEYYVKRALLLDDVVYFTADNTGGDHAWKKPKRMDDERHPIEIIGRVRWIGSWED